MKLRPKSSAKPLIFNKSTTNFLVPPTPGVGEYDLDKSVGSITSQSPRVFIGSESRFGKPNKNPGVGDYNLLTSLEMMKRKSPKATIGSAKRFVDPEICQYKCQTPCGYDTSRKQEKTPFGTIGTAKRFIEYKQMPTPGVGDYNVEKFKRMDKASETQFYFNL